MGAMRGLRTAQTVLAPIGPRWSCNVHTAIETPFAANPMGGLGADPLALGQPSEVQREVGVDVVETSGAEVGQWAGQVGGESGSHERRRLDTGDQLATIADPRLTSARRVEPAVGRRHHVEGGIVIHVSGELVGRWRVPDRRHGDGIVDRVLTDGEERARWPGRHRFRPCASRRPWPAPAGRPARASSPPRPAPSAGSGTCRR